MIRLIAGAGMLLLTMCVNAFEVKGISPGMPISEIDLSACEKVANADSGIPGYRCHTTIGGDNAVLRIVVFEERVVAAIFSVENGHMSPVKDALADKFGQPWKRNRYIEDYSWGRGGLTMSIKEARAARGYVVLLMDMALFKRAAQANADRANKDL